MKRPARAISLSGLVWAAGFAASCSGPGPAPNVYSEDPGESIPGMKKAAREKDRSVVPALVKDLESDDAAVRFYAIESLRRITGQDLGYEYFQDDAGRKDATERWRQWAAAAGGGKPG